MLSGPVAEPIHQSLKVDTGPRGRRHEIDQPTLLGCCRGQRLVLTKQPERGLRADESGQAIGSPAAGDESATHLRALKSRRRRVHRQTNVARQHEFQTSPETTTFDHGDRRPLESAEFPGNLLAATSKRRELQRGCEPAQLGRIELFQKGVCRTASNDDDFGRGKGGDSIEDQAQFIEQGQREGMGRAVAEVEPKGNDLVVGFEAKGLGFVQHAGPAPSGGGASVHYPHLGPNRRYGSRRTATDP